MAIPEKTRPRSLEEAVAELKRDPARPVHARVDELEVELRVVAANGNDALPALGTRMAALGPWLGESTEEIVRILEHRTG